MGNLNNLPAELPEYLRSIDSLDKLKEAFTSIIPKHLCQEISGATPEDLNFPPGTVAEITEEDICDLETRFGSPEESLDDWLDSFNYTLLARANRYSVWAAHYVEMNRMKLDEGQSGFLVAKIQEMGLPLARSVLLVTKALMRQRESRINFYMFAGGQNREILDATTSEGKAVRLATDTLLELLDRANDPWAEPIVLGARAPIRAWRNKDQLRELLEEFKEILTSTYEELSFWETYSQKHGTPNKQLDTPDSVYRAFEGILEMVEKNKYPKTTQAVTEEIFKQVGMKITYDAYRQEEYRREQK